MKTLHNILAAIAALILLAAGPAGAHEVKAGDITIIHPWARASSGMARSGGAFMTIANDGTRPEKLISARTTIAAKTMLHKTVMDGDVMKMTHVKGGIAIPAGDAVELKPGSYHIMLMGLKAPLKEGTSFPLSLTFEHAGTVTVEVKVMKPGAKGMKHD